MGVGAGSCCVAVLDSEADTTSCITLYGFALNSLSPSSLNVFSADVGVIAITGLVGIGSCVECCGSWRLSAERLR